MMKRIAICALVLAMSFLPLVAIGSANENLTRTRVGALPTSGPSGMSRIVTDGANEADCTIGNGSFAVLCSFDGVSTWTAGGGGAGGGASTTNHFLTSTDDTADLPNSTNLGALSTGFLKCITVGGVCTVATDPAVVSTGSANTYASGMKQTFAPNATNAGMNLGPASADPSAPSNGDTYYNSNTNKCRIYENGAWKDCDTTGGGGMTVGGAVGSSLHNGLLYTDNTGLLTELDCADGEVATQASGLWTCGTVDAASRALDNLASVAINAALLPASAAGLDFGSATKPWKDFYLAGASGTPGTNNFKLTGASTSGTRTITLPDATGTAVVYTGSPANNDCAKFSVSGGITTLVTNGSACGSASVAAGDNVTVSGSTVSYTPVDPSTINIREEFFSGSITTGAIGREGWSFANIGGAPSIGRAAGAVPNLGLVTMATSTTSGQGGVLYLHDTANGFGVLGNLTANTNWEEQWIFKIDSTANVRFRIGLATTGATGTQAEPDDGFWLRYDTNAAYSDTAWNFVCRSGATNTVPTPTGTMTVGTTFFRLRIYSTVAGTVNFQLYGATGTSLATGSCSSGTPTANMSPKAIIVTDTTAAKTLTADFFAYKMSGLSR